MNSGDEEKIRVSSCRQNSKLSTGFCLKSLKFCFVWDWSILSSGTSKNIILTQKWKLSSSSAFLCMIKCVYMQVYLLICGHMKISTFSVLDTPLYSHSNQSKLRHSNLCAYAWLCCSFIFKV